MLSFNLFEAVCARGRLFLFPANGYLTLEHFLEGDERLAATQSHLDELVVDDVEQVVVVLGIEFDEQVILAGGVVALHDLGHGLQSLNNLVELRGVIEEEPDVGAGAVTYLIRVNQ